MRTVDLYHGTTEEHAAALLINGWSPHSGPRGGNCGNPALLYCTTEPHDALWFAEQKGGAAVIVIRGVTLSSCRVDPEDGIGESVEDELAIGVRNGTPAKLSIVHPIAASRLARFEG